MFKAINQKTPKNLQTQSRE